MATQDLEKLVVQLSADFKSFEKEMAKAQKVSVRELRKIEKQADSSLVRINNSMRKLGAGILGAVGIVGIQQLGQAIQDVIGNAAKLGDLADRTGLSTAALQGLETAAKEADLSFEGLGKTLLKFSAVLGEAKVGQGKFLETLQGLGLSVKGDTLSNLRQLADIIAGLNDENQQLFVLRQALGKGSDAYLEIFQKGAAGIEDMIAKTKGLSDESIRTAQTIDDKLAVSILNLGRDAQSAVIEALKAFKFLDENIPTPEEMGKTAADWVRSLVPVDSALGQLIAAQNAAAAGSVGTPEHKPPPFSSAPKKTFTLKTKDETDAETKALKDQEKALKLLNDEREREQEMLADQRASFFDDIASVRERTDAIIFETEHLGDSTAEIERARVAQELLNSAREHGQELTPGVVQAIDELARAHGDAAEALERMQEQEQLLTSVGDTFKSSITGFVSAIASGVAPVDALNNSLQNLADQLLDMATNQLITQLFKSLLALGGGTASPAGGMGLQASALYHKGGVAGQGGPHRSVPASTFIGAPRLHNGLRGDEFPAILQAGETVMPRGWKGGGGYGRVVVNNYGGQIEQRQQRNERGQTELHLWFRANFQRELSSQSTAKTLSAGFGITPLKKRR